MSLEPAPLRVRRSRAPLPPSAQSSYPALHAERLAPSLLSGAGVAASFSAACVLQFLYPAFRAGGLPLAGIVGLLLGWTFACPVVWTLARVLDRSKMWQVVGAAVGAGLILVVPALFCAQSLGWTASPVALLALGALLGGSGLVWGGYLDFDHPADF